MKLNAVSKAVLDDLSGYLVPVGFALPLTLPEQPGYALLRSSVFLGGFAVDPM